MNENSKKDKNEKVEKDIEYKEDIKNEKTKNEIDYSSAEYNLPCYCFQRSCRFCFDSAGNYIPDFCYGTNLFSNEPKNN